MKQNVEIKRAFTKTLINHFSTLQNRDTDNIKSANTQYIHFEETCKEASSIEIPLKPKQEKRIPWESVKILQKCETFDGAADLKESTPTLKNIDDFINAQKSLVISYKDEHKAYIKETKFKKEIKVKDDNERVILFGTFISKNYLEKILKRKR